VTVKRLSIALPSSPGLNSKSVLGGPGLVLRRIATVLASPGYLLLDSWPRNWIRPAGISWIWWVSGCVAVLGLTVWVGSCAGVGCLAIARCVIRCLDVKFELFLSFFGEVLRFRWRSAGEPGPDSCLALLDLWNLFAPFLVRFFPLLRLFRPESKLPVKAGAS